SAQRRGPGEWVQPAASHTSPPPARLTLIVYVTAGPVADWYDLPRAEPILQALAFALILNCLAVAPNAWLQRQFRFRDLALIEITSMVIGMAVAIFSAVRGAGAWALVWQQLSAFAVKSSLLWLSARVPLRFDYDVREIRAVVPFISNLLGSQVVNFFARNSDNIIIARMLGDVALGFYAIAYRIMLMPIQFLSWGMTSVLLPTLSTFKSDTARVKAACLRVFRIIALVTFPAMAGIAALAEPVVVIVLGEAWLPSAAVLALLAPIGALQSLTSAQGGMFMALGRTDVLFRYTVLTTIIVIAAFLIGTQYGLVGTATAYLAANLLLALPLFRSLLTLIDANLGDMFQAVGTTALVSTVMGFGVWALADELRLGGASSLDTLIICIPVGAALYAAGLAALDRPAFGEIVGLGKTLVLRS
ncbi:MAG: lipopolysaccharide biosynthesis protein, partial [Pseudomonadota bacterium]